jgi:hypothetical protein
LLGRSHFRDLQFLHAMADADGVDAKATVERLLSWAEFLYRVARMSIPGSARLSETSMGGIFALPAPLLVKELFLSPRNSTTQARAAGALLHTLQDSFAAGHVERDGQGRIVQFHAYGGQDGDKHAADDEWVVSSGSAEERIRALHGGQEAVAASTTILRYIKSDAPWPTVASYLKEGPWALSAAARPSGPGTGYTRSK